MQHKHSTSGLSSIIAAALLLAGCSQMEMGSTSAKTTATGSAGGSTSIDANSQLERCNESLGTLALVEDTSAPWYGQLTGQYHLPSTVPVLRLLAQQSNCFIIVERGRAMDNMMQERALQESGELRSNSKFGKGQMASADYTMSPTITFSNQNAGGIGGGIGGWGGAIAGILAANVNFKEASTLLTLIDNRSGVQVAISEGSARNTDFGAMGALFGSHAAGGLGGYTNTAEGKVIVAAFTDAYNNLVRAARAYEPQYQRGGLGTGGGLKVQGGDEAMQASEPPPQPTKKSRRK